MLNLVALQGRLTADPELRQTPQGISVARFTVAVDRGYAKPGEERKADFISCTAWRTNAEFLCKYFHKGSAIVLSGSIQTGSYDDKETGKKRYTTDVVADSINFGESKNSQGSQGGSFERTQTTAPAAFSAGSADDFATIDDNEDLPF